MARNDGIDRVSARNVNLAAAKIGNAQRHNECEKESYTNQDIISERTPKNIRFKKPTALTSTEHRNAYMGESRDQVKYLSDMFVKLGARKEVIGFSNSRLAYDEIISKFCYTVE